MVADGPTAFAACGAGEFINTGCVEQVLAVRCNSTQHV